MNMLFDHRFVLTASSPLLDGQQSDAFAVKI